MKSKQVVASFLLLCGLLVCGLWWNESQVDVNDIGLGVFKETPSAELNGLIPDTARAEGLGVDEFLAEVSRSKEPSAGVPLGAVKPEVDEFLSELLRSKESSAGAPLGAVKPNEDLYFEPINEKKVEEFPFPMNTVGLLYFTVAQQTHACTATLISRSFILTAGNCVHEGNGGNYYSAFVFSVGGRAYVPVPLPGQVHTFDEWSRDGNLKFNFGWIKLQGTPGVDSADDRNEGWMKIDYSTTSLDPNLELHSVGYPILDRNGDFTLDMFSTECTPNLAVYADYWLTDTCSTGYFSSGSPVYFSDKFTEEEYPDYVDKVYGVVVSHYDYPSKSNPDFVDYNLFVRLTESKFYHIWRYIEYDS